MNEHLHQLALDYPLSPVPRYPLGLQSHPALTRLLASHREHYLSVIESFIGYGDDLARIPLLPTGVELTEADLAALPERLTQAYHGDQAALVWFAPFIDQVYQSPDPCWINGFMPDLDAIGLYSFIARYQPKSYVEIGSGNSTKFARNPYRIIALKPPSSPLTRFPGPASMRCVTR